MYLTRYVATGVAHRSRFANYSSMVERQYPKLKFAGSNPVNLSKMQRLLR